MRAAVIENGTVVNVIVVDDADDPANYGAQECPDSVGPGWGYSNGEFTAPEAPPPEAEPPVSTVAATQAKIQLFRTKRDGSDLLTMTEGLVAASGDKELELWFNGAQTWRIDNPHIQNIGGYFGLGPEEIQGLFTAANQIDA